MTGGHNPQASVGSGRIPAKAGGYAWKSRTQQPGYPFLARAVKPPVDAGKKRAGEDPVDEKRKKACRKVGGCEKLKRRTSGQA